jgi:hypothetical protein
MTTFETRLKIDSWDEQPFREHDDGRKLTRAAVGLSAAEGITSGSMDALMYYAPEGTGSYASVMELTGTLDGRSGSFTLIGQGSYDGTSAVFSMTVVPGSGTGGLHGIRGTAGSASTHEDYPFMPLSLDYTLG